MYIPSFFYTQSNGKVERFHRTMHDVLAKKIRNIEYSWDIYLNQMLAAVPFLVSNTTNFYPYYLHVILPLDNILRPQVHQWLLKSFQANSSNVLFTSIFVLLCYQFLLLFSRVYSFCSLLCCLPCYSWLFIFYRDSYFIDITLIVLLLFFLVFASYPKGF